MGISFVRFDRRESRRSQAIVDCKGIAHLAALKIDTEYDRAKVPPYNGNDPPPAPGSLKCFLFPTLLNEVQNKGTQGVRARYGAELPPIISIVRYPGRLVISQKIFRYLWRFYSLLFRGFSVVFPWLFRGPLLSRKTVFGPFSWLFCWTQHAHLESSQPLG